MAEVLLTGNVIPVIVPPVREGNFVGTIQGISGPVVLATVLVVVGPHYNTLPLVRHNHMLKDLFAVTIHVPVSHLLPLSTWTMGNQWPCLSFK